MGKEESDTWHSFLYVACAIEIGITHYIISCDLAFVFIKGVMTPAHVK
jgi:hypothetical protein